MKTLKERMQQLADAPRVKAASVTAEGDLRLVLPNDATVSIAARSLRRLRELSAEQLADVRVTGGGQVLLWPEAGESFEAAALLEAITGLRHAKYDAVATGAQGGRARSEAKTAASRANGAKGGRPRKVSAV